MLVPSKLIREAFIVIYELEGSKRAISFLCNHYKIRKMKIILDGRKVRKGKACYYQNVAYFTPKGLNRKVVLHEFFHHLVYCKKMDMTHRPEEQEADLFVKQFLKFR